MKSTHQWQAIRYFSSFSVKPTNTKTISIKLTSSGSNEGPFDILDLQDILLLSDVTKEQLIEGISFEIDKDATAIKVR